MAVIVLFLIWDAQRGWGWSGLGGKTLWDWLQLLGALAIPIVVAVLGALFARREREREERQRHADAEREELYRQTEREIAEQNRQEERRIADDRAREAVLGAYLDAMSELLLNEGLAESEEGAKVRQIARVRTLTALRRLDGVRKGVLLRFLYESDLIGGITDGAEQGEVVRNPAVVILVDADLSNTNLYGATLRGARLSNANLYSADLSHADLRDAKVTDEQLAETHSLEGATMPDGSKHD